MIEKRTELREYPDRGGDPEMDFEATKTHFGRGSCIYALLETQLKSRTLVYMLQQRESYRFIDTPRGPGRICEQGIIICGYKTRRPGISGFLRRKVVSTIAEEERQSIQSELLNKVKLKPAYVEFW